MTISAFPWPHWREAMPLTLLVLALALLLRFFAAVSPSVEAPADLERGLPTRFGDWTLIAGGPDQISPLPNEAELEAYDQQVTRSYRDGQGRTVMLTLAYVRGNDTRSTAHDPRLCYPGAGFDILQWRPAVIDGIEGRRMLARRGQRLEAASYWIRSGDRYGLGNLATRGYLLGQRLRGHVPDGMLVRASALIRDEAQAPASHAWLEDFLTQLPAASPPSIRRLLRP